MILNNFLGWLFGCSNADGTRARQSTTYYDIHGELATLNGSAQNSFFNTLKYLPSDFTRSNNGDFCIALGTSNAPNTPDYYAWENGITTLTNSGYSYSVSLKDGKRTIRISRTVTNDTAEDITVSEVGLLVCTYGYTVLLAREVLDTPITVKANGGAQVFGIDIG